MNGLNLSFQNVLENDGIAIAITGMSIVFAALVFISVFIAILPRALNALSAYLPAEGEGHGHAAPATAATAVNDEDEIIAAIGFVLHQENRLS